MKRILTVILLLVFTNPVFADTSTDEFFSQSIRFGQTNGKMNDKFIDENGKNVTDSNGNNYGMYAVQHFYDKYGNDILSKFFNRLIQDEDVIAQANSNGDTLLTLLIKKHKDLISNQGNQRDIKRLSDYIKTLQEMDASYGKFPKLASYNLTKRKKIKVLSILSDYLYNGSMLSSKEAERRIKEELGGQFYKCPVLPNKKSKGFSKQEFVDCTAWLSGADPMEDVVGYMTDFYDYLQKVNLTSEQTRSLAVDIYGRYYASSDLANKSVHTSYKYSLGEKVSYYGYTNNSGWEGVVMGKSNSRYKVKIARVSIKGSLFTSQLNASTCSGNIDISDSNKGEDIWVPIYCVE